jgi:hypothetical protein
MVSLAPCLAMLALWFAGEVAGRDFRWFYFSVGKTLVEVTSTSWRALEVAVVSNPVFVPRGAEYCVLPKAHPPIWGMYFGPVAVPAPSRAVIVLVPYYALFLAAAGWPATLLWRAWRRRTAQPAGFAVE